MNKSEIERLAETCTQIRRDIVETLEPSARGIRDPPCPSSRFSRRFIFTSFA